MKACRLALFCGIGMVLSLHLGWGRPVDLSAPTGELGAANSKGYLEIWREIDDVGLQLGKGSYLPLRYKFSTDPTTGGILGPGFYMPMFEAKNVLIRESTMRAYLPCGKGLYMWRDNVDPNKFKSVDQQWTGYLMGDDYVVWRDDGWKVQYHKSRLSSITSDDGHVFTWVYDQSGLPQSVSENGQALITLEPNVAGQIAAITYMGKRYELQYGERPITEMLLGQVGIKELDQALSSFKYPDGTVDTFNFVLTPDRVPTLNFATNNKHQTSYTWNPANDYIATEKGPRGDWTYKIGGVTEEFGTPPISRTDMNGITESKSLDSATGVTVFTSPAFGKITTRIFTTPGPLYGKTREIIQEQKGIAITLRKCSYDDVGNLIRETNEKGFSLQFSYGPDGNLLKRTVIPPNDPEVLKALANKEKQILSAISSAKGAGNKSGLIEQLAFFYIHEEGDPGKAVALLPQLLSRKQQFNVQLHAIDGDATLSGEQKAAKFKDLLTKFPEESKLLNLLIKARSDEDSKFIAKANDPMTK